MSLKLPPTDSPLRTLFDVTDLAKRAAPSERAKLPTLREAKAYASRELEPGHTVAVTYFVLAANGDVELIRFHRALSLGYIAHSRLWNFGQ